MMEDTNNQGDTIGIDNNDGNTNDISDIEEEDSHNQGVILDQNIFQRLKQNDPAITHLHVEFSNAINAENYFTDIDWKVDGACIANNAHLKTIRITHRGFQAYILGEQGNNLPTKQQLQDFFSCIYRNRFIKALVISKISINGKFCTGLIEGLSGHPSLVRLDIGPGKLGHIGCPAVGKVLAHPYSKLKSLLFPCCNIYDREFSIICDALLGNSTIKRLNLGGNYINSSVGWGALATVLRHPNCKLVDLDVR